jgi:hypothetical protein
MIKVSKVTLGFYPSSGKKSFAEPEHYIVFDPERKAFCVDGTWHDGTNASWLEDVNVPEVIGPLRPAEESTDGGHQPGPPGESPPRTRSRKR